jgi:nitric oxide reductase subunit B
VYVYMWTAGALYFVYTFAEGHAYLLPSVADHPVADLQIQWKSCGTLVASFNQMVFGALMYMAERQSRDKRIAHSRVAFGLLAVGLLNSLTNYGHHTYHLPQNHLIKWISFGVSMLEVILLWRVLLDVVRLSVIRGRTRPNFVVWKHFAELALRWNLFLLTLAILISVPSLNAMIHGTHVVMAHAMGSMLAIDTYILLGVFAWLLAQIFPKAEVRAGIIDSPAARRAIAGLNIALVCTVVVLLVEGLAVGYTRRLGESTPGWLGYFPLALAFSGTGVGYHLIRLMQVWMPLLRESTRHKLFRNDPRWDRHVTEMKPPVE